MEVKDLFDAEVKKNIVRRVNALTPGSRALWGKMKVQQMLRHVQLPMLVPYGRHEPQGSLLLKLLGPMMKGVLYNDKPYRKSLPTDQTYVVKDEKEFETERQKLLTLLEEFVPENLKREVHPIFGKMTMEQWSKSMWKHLDHHLTQFGV